MKKLVLVAVLASIGGVAVYKWKSAPRAEATDAKLVTDRIWIDHMPRNDKDIVQIFAAISDNSIGVFQSGSQWTGQFEIFRYELSGDDMRMVYPQTNSREKATVRARKCNENRMDFCLEIDGASRGVKKYYSREGWELGAGDLDSVKHRVDQVVEQLETSAAAE